jgi:fructose-1,6-bisphosphatase I
MLVLTTGSGVTGFTLDTLIGEWAVTHRWVLLASRWFQATLSKLNAMTMSCDRLLSPAFTRARTEDQTKTDSTPSPTPQPSRSITIPQRGVIYSLNDAREHDWPEGLRRYINNLRQGKGQHPKQYSARYICSLGGFCGELGQLGELQSPVSPSIVFGQLWRRQQYGRVCLNLIQPLPRKSNHAVADFHRTLLYGGWCANPRPHLRLVYEGNPLALLAEQAGGRGSDGKQRVLAIPPEKLHQRLPLFLGSPADIDELESYGDVQQGAGKKYDV